MSTYDPYAKGAAFLKEYNDYQKRYATHVKESDRVFLDLVAKVAKDKPALSLLDIGCSTGNLLMHLKRAFPSIVMTGADVAESSLMYCRNNKELASASFEKADILNLGYEAKFDIIIASAVCVYFTWEEYAASMRSIAKALKPGGIYMAFEWLHPWEWQDLVIQETSQWQPDGLRICFRPMKKVANVMRESGLSSINFIPFDIPIELPMPEYDQEVVSYTISTGNKNMCFRGALHQPWCHVTAQRAL